MYETRGTVRRNAVFPAIIVTGDTLGDALRREFAKPRGYDYAKQRLGGGIAAAAIGFGEAAGEGTELGGVELPDARLPAVASSGSGRGEQGTTRESSA